ncbi:GNAT family N-acetyltransferase [Lachnoclostridium phytofermentans]|uniref:GCN5-related N-acetyltransferase n=1 Tax=Lachnoclostridium phytofermentans (strain ATCC 700394 / DSM 18823 / ISDg) TaxID=357809 RepID=A9KSX5_LACP7|nr:GNAT family N-acetyltransferase [Lachnoclostridium phytofermentans]ABX42186.1 GCN5-related N-acetyltransferase [Lachnoclostridium phytofermentans ISDg]
MNIEIVDNALTPEIYIDVRKQVNFKYYEYDDVKIALKNSLYSVVIFDDGKPIGISRVVGDGRIVFFIKDVVVVPEYQKLKVGSMLMNRIEQYLSNAACDGAYIGLMSTPGQTEFYKKFGFIERPTDEFGPGMVKYHSK